MQRISEYPCFYYRGSRAKCQPRFPKFFSAAGETPPWGTGWKRIDRGGAGTYTGCEGAGAIPRAGRMEQRKKERRRMKKLLTLPEEQVEHMLATFHPAD